MSKILELLNQNIGKSFLSPSPVGKWLDGTLLEAELGRLAVEFTVKPEFVNPMQMMHGGIHATMMDDVLGALVYSLDNEYAFNTLNISVDYLSPAKLNEKVKVVAEVIKQGRNIIHCEAKIYNMEGKILSKSISNLAKTHIKLK